ncbi:TIGR03943 family putative permease subunit [Clostridium estertheticum]|uniref:TIGR03943 family putative permease subunit n=1 Tax=Clostridium estertheticum TaxID=238834 RepID=UPI001C0BD401|nr:TIGR03943 family protein [Clostridium estertheticum]MBU3076120.1 TIGR03943 family protein [Clostridium estertheticum]MBU3165919.1 TIGR03943 family protein [Clostridium estertheticum]MBU3173982.1 TIGR03943 family protein [Clostridium estertheticum]
MGLIKIKKINIEVLLKLVILTGFAFFFYDIIKSKKVLLYVAPRIIPYIKFGIVAMISLSLFIIRDIFKPKRKVNIKPYLFFIIPLLMAFMMPEASVSSKSMSLVGAKSVSQIDNIKQKNITDKGIINKDKITGNTTTKTNSSKVDEKLEMHDNTIVISDNNFEKWTEEISNNMLKYEGKKIELIGFVFKADGFKNNEFVPARLMMTCCAADLVPVGLLANYDKAKDLKQDTWIKVTGKIKILNYNGEKTPIIIVESIKNTEKSKIEYVYPF